MRPHPQALGRGSRLRLGGSTMTSTIRWPAPLCECVKYVYVCVNVNRACKRWPLNTVLLVLLTHNSNNRTTTEVLNNRM